MPEWTPGAASQVQNNIVNCMYTDEFLVGIGLPADFLFTQDMVPSVPSITFDQIRWLEVKRTDTADPRLFCTTILCMLCCQMYLVSLVKN